MRRWSSSSDVNPSRSAESSAAVSDLGDDEPGDVDEGPRC